MQSPRVREVVRLVANLLPRRDRILLGAMAAVQVGLGLLDLFGVFLIAMLTGVLVNGLVSGEHQGSALPSWIPFHIASSRGLAALGLLAALLLIVKSLISVALLNKILTYLARRETYVATQLTRALLAAPLTVIRQEQSHINAYSVGQGVTQIVTQLLGNGLSAVGDVALLGLLGIALLVVDPVMTIVTMLYFVAVGAILYRLIARQASAAGLAATDANNHSVGAVMEAQWAFRELSVLSRRDFYVRKFEALRSITAQRWARLLLLAQLPKTALEAVLVMAVVVLAGTQALFSGNATKVSTALALFMAASARILPAVIRLQTSLTSMNQAVSTSAPTVELIARLREVAEKRGLITADSTGNIDRWAVTRETPPPSAAYPGFAGEVELHHVSYSYPGATVAAVNDVTFSVREGEHVALVGPSGAGKSTILDLVLAVLEPDEGKVAVSGCSPAEAIDGWPGAIAYVPQEAFLTSGTIAENVALGIRPDQYDSEAMWRALNLARLDDFVAGLPEGLETRLGERGSTISGGQRQRLGLARALYSAPRLLLLDEATSALDADTERAVTDALQSMAGEVTTITVAHRWATVRHASQIHYIAEGRILASGTFDDLVDVLPDFARQASLMGLH